MAGHININDKIMWQNLLHGAEFHIGRIKGLTENPAVGTVYRASMDNTYFPYISVYNFDSQAIPLPSLPSSSASSSQSKEQQEKDHATLWKYIGVVGTIVAAYFTGKTLRSYQERAATLEITTDLHGQLLLKTCQQTGDKRVDQLWKTLSDVVELYHYVIKSECEKSSNYFYGAVVVLLGFASMATGGFLAAATWITVGKVAAFVGAIFIALNWGYHTQSDILDYACAGLIGTPSKPGLLKVANLALDQVNDEMALNQQPVVQDAWNNYQPLYQQIPAYQPSPAYNPFWHVKIPEASAPPEGL